MVLNVSLNLLIINIGFTAEFPKASLATIKKSPVEMDDCFRTKMEEDKERYLRFSLSNPNEELTIKKEVSIFPGLGQIG